MSLDLTLVEVRLPFRAPLHTAAGIHHHRTSVLVGLEDEGFTGWGEAPAFPSGRFGTAEAAWEALVAWDGSAVPGVPIAAAALEAARTDLQARREGVPLHRHLGGGDEGVTARHPHGLAAEIDSLIEGIALVAASGIRAIKLKVTPGSDIDPVRAIRTTFPDIDLAVDANGTYPQGDPALGELDAAGVTLVEQPFPADDLQAHARLRAQVAMKVCLDESVTSRGADEILAAGAADVLALKVNRLGLTAATEILELGREAGVEVKAGGTFDTSIGRRHVLAFATLPGVIEGEVAPPAGYLAADVADYPEVIEGRVSPRGGPGIGAEPDRELLEGMIIRELKVDGR